jgi:hypothetical protein
MNHPRWARLAALAATAIFATTAAATAAGATETPSPGSQQRIGLVVQDGAAVAPKFACVDYTQGMTGDDVLKAAQHQLTFDKSNFLSQIDGVPTTVKPFDSKHPAYWSYWHLASSGKWTFSDKGGDTAKPAPGTIDGWFYVNGATYTPTSVTFGQICTNTPSPSAIATTVAAAKKSSSGSKTAVVVGVGVVVVLGAAAALVSRRNRQH